MADAFGQSAGPAAEPRDPVGPGALDAAGEGDAEGHRVEAGGQPQAHAAARARHLAAQPRDEVRVLQPSRILEREDQVAADPPRGDRGRRIRGAFVEHLEPAREAIGGGQAPPPQRSVEEEPRPCAQLRIVSTRSE